MNKKFLHQSADKKILGIIRCGVFGLWFVIIFNAPITSYGSLPIELFKPWGIYKFILSPIPEGYFQFILSFEFLLSIKYLLLVCCLLCFLGIRPWKILAGFTVLLLFLFDGIIQSFYGFANHAQLGIQLIAVVLAIFPSADGWSVLGSSQTNNKQEYISALLLCSIILCLPYMFIGMHRILYGGFELFTNDAILNYLSIRDLQYAEHNINQNPFILNYPSLFPLIKLGFFCTTLLEISTPLILTSHRFRYVWISIMIPFHVFTFITMNIFFWENIILIILLLTEFPYLFNDTLQKNICK